MNIQIPNSWLREFVKTSATNKEIANALSLCAFGVEKVENVNGENVYTIEITPNRYDAISVNGVAREVATVLPQFGHKVTLEVQERILPSSLQPNPSSPNLIIDVEIADTKLCPHFAALVLDKVKIQPSSKKVQKYLELAGTRALNNVVDATNYVMIETGQPLHAFDYDKITEQKMIVGASKEGDKIITLDGVERNLPAGAIIIKDGGKIIDLCGIMGGKNSAIDENTTKVLLFAQIYDPVSLRKTSMALGHRTEAALRFEKGLDPEMVVPALLQSAQMLVESGAEVASELVEIRQNEFSPHNVTASLDKINKYLGVEITLKKAGSLLEALQLNPHIEKGRIVCTIPSWRDKDLQTEEDLIEEIARLYGYHNLPTTLPSGQPPAEIVNKQFKIERRLKYLLKDLGFTEVYTNSMVPESFISPTKYNQSCTSPTSSEEETTPHLPLKIRNPFTKDMTYMRTSLVPSLLGVVEKNKPNRDAIKIFEMANVYTPKEEIVLTAMVYKKGGIAEKQQALSELKTVVRTSLEELNITDSVKTEILGTGNTLYTTLNLQTLVEASRTHKKYVHLPHTSIYEDYSLSTNIDEDVTQICNMVRENPLVIKVELGEDPRNLGNSKKSVFLKVEYNSPEKQLTEQDIKPTRKQILKTLKKRVWGGIKIMKKQPGNYAFIDSQNLNLGIRNQGWALDFARFRVYLKDKLNVTKAYLFIGYVTGNESLYTYLQQADYIVIFKPTMAIRKKDGTKTVKGNVDAELVLHTMLEYNNYSKAVIVSGDGDFRCLLEYLDNNKKLHKLIIPNKKKYSCLLLTFKKYMLFLTKEFKGKLGDKK